MGIGESSHGRQVRESGVFERIERIERIERVVEGAYVKNKQLNEGCGEKSERWREYGVWRWDSGIVGWESMG